MFFRQYFAWQRNRSGQPSLTTQQKPFLIPILIHVAKTRKTFPMENSAFFWHSSILEVLTKLLSCRELSIIEQAIDLVYTILPDLQSVQETYDSTKNLHGLVRALAMIASNDYLSNTRKERLVQSFSIIINQSKNIHSLAREPIIVSFLVHIVGNSFNGVVNRESREIAVCVLIKLARNPCNRRLLAKTPGLLSSMIQYVRQNQHNVEDLIQAEISRSEIKKQIYLLAKAL